MDIKKELLTTSSSSLTPVQKQSLENYLPQNFLPKIRQITTISQALKEGTSSLAKIKKHVGSERAEALIKVYLIRLNEMLDLKKGLSEDAMDGIAAALVKQYYALTMVDIAYVLEKALRGEYGELYESISMPKVMKWFKDYFDQRCDTAEEQNRIADHQHNSLFGRERSSENMTMREAMKEYTINKRIEKYNEHVKNNPPNKL